MYNINKNMEYDITFPSKVYDQVGEIVYTRQEVTDMYDKELVGHKEIYTIYLRTSVHDKNNYRPSVSGQSLEEAMTKLKMLIDKREMNGIKSKV